MGLVAGACWLLVFSLMIGSFSLPRGVTCDFLSFYTGGLAARHGAIARVYDLAYLRGIEAGLVPQAPDFLPFTRFPWFAVALAPLTWLAVLPAFWVWASLQMAAFAGICVWVFRRFGADALLGCGLYLPTIFGLVLGQDGVWILLLVLAAFVLMERGRDGAAGAVLGLALVKFHLLLLFPLAFALRKRWRMLASFSLAGLAQALLFFVLEGAHGLGRYLDVLRWWGERSPRAEPYQFLSARTILLNFGVESWWWSAFAITLVVALAWFCCRETSREPWRWFAAAAIASVLISPHAFRYDGTFLLLPILLCLFQAQSRVTRVAAGVAVSPLPQLVAVLGPPFWCAPAVSLLLLLGALAAESNGKAPDREAVEREVAAGPEAPALNVASAMADR